MRSSSFISIYVIFIVTPFLIYHSQAQAQGLDSIIQLPRSSSTRTRSKSRRVLSITHFGAIGDGFHNDTQVILLRLLVYLTYKMYLFFTYKCIIEVDVGLENFRIFIYNYKHNTLLSI